MLIFVGAAPTQHHEISSHLHVNPENIAACEIVVNRSNNGRALYTVMLHLTDPVRLFGAVDSNCFKVECDTEKDAFELINRLNAANE